MINLYFCIEKILAMATFRTEIKIDKNPVLIQQSDSIFTIGSCFAEVIGQKLKARKFDIEVSPLGTLFCPDAIFNSLNFLMGKGTLNEKHWVEDEGVYQHLDFHSSFGQLDHQSLEDNLYQLQQDKAEQLKKAKFLIITFGTAFTYQYLETKKFIANCHKMPANWFRKDLVHVKHICQGFEYTFQNLKKLNPNLNIILTVSPVRHTKDGLAENNLSKSILRASCHYLQNDFENVSYFPAFEIMMDDLRDYRFYKSDLIHPSELAEDYIFEQFSAAYFDEKTKNIQAKWQQIQSDLAHRPFHEKSEEHQKFLKKLLVKLEQISADIEVNNEILETKKRIFVP